MIILLLTADGSINSRRDLGRMCLINRHIYNICTNLPATLPERVIRRRAKRRNAEGEVIRRPNGKAVMCTVTTRTPELVITPVIKLSEFLVWRDLDEAYNCVRQHRENLTFWMSIRVIHLRFIESFRTGNLYRRHGPRRVQFRKAHWVFLWLAGIYRELNQNGEAKIDWLRIEISEENSIMSTDVAGVFGLSQMPGIKHLTFVSPRGQAIRYYISTSVKRFLCRCAAQNGVYPWTGDGTETAWMETSWQERAALERKPRESDNKLWMRWMTRRLNLCNRVSSQDI